MIYEKITSRRTIRKYERKSVPEKVLMKCVDAARLSPSGANRQPLKYVVVNDQDLLKEVFSTLGWISAGLSTERRRDAEGVRGCTFR